MQGNTPEKTDKLKLDEISSPMLAYLGDAVIELLVRRKLALDGVPNTGEANRLSHGYVTAKAQSEAVGRLEGLLTEREEDIYRRGRNHASKNCPRRSTPGQYHRATGLEALFGRLWLEHEFDRIEELFAAAYPGCYSNPACLGNPACLNNTPCDKNTTDTEDENAPTT